MTVAGQLRHRITFDRREDVNPDAPLDLGNVQSEFVEQFTVWAAMQAKLGGEAVTAARLTGQQPVNITVRQSPQTRQIRTDWRARDGAGTIYAVRSIIDPDDSGAYLEILTQTGAPA